MNSQTHQPIQAVQVRKVTPGQPADDTLRGGQLMQQTPPVRTDADGRFFLVSERDLSFFQRLSWYSVTLSFQHSGYAPFTTSYTLANATNTPSGEPLVKAGDILLVPLSK